MTKIILRIVTALSVMVVLLTGMAWAEMVIHLKNGQEIRHPVDRGDVASIEYTDSGHHGGRGKENGTPWVVNSNGNIFRRTGGSWQMLPGLAKDIGVGADGSVWVIGMDSTGGGYSIHQWNGSNWTRIDGGAIRIAVAPDGNPWVVNSNDNIFRRTGGSWQMLPGLAKDIGVGADGSVWVIGTDSTGGGYGIHRWNGSNWTKIDGGAVRVAVAPDGNPWVVNSNDNIFRRTGGSWQMLPGLAKDIGVGADGSVWVIGTDSTGGGYGIHRWNGSNWTKIDGGAVQITVR